MVASPRIGAAGLSCSIKRHGLSVLRWVGLWRSGKHAKVQTDAGRHVEWWARTCFPQFICCARGFAIAQMKNL